MGKVYITGDVHGALGMHKFSHKENTFLNELTKDDLIIITGDFGLIFNNEETKLEKMYLDFLSKKPYNIAFVDGNHENHYKLNKLPIIAEYSGLVGRVRDNIFHFKRGQIYTINKKTFFCMGGAISVDRHKRTLNIDWWKEEQPTFLECQEAWENLSNYGFKVDYIISHTIPFSMIPKVHTYNTEKDTANTFFDEILSNNIQYKKWFAGHFHVDQELGNNIRVVYDDF